VTAFVNQANAEKIDGFIQDNHCITVSELAEIVRTSVSSLKAIVHVE
jgi:hypothetical protein